MENQQSPSRKNIMVTYGVILGFISILISVINYAFGNVYEPHWSIQVISFLVMTAIIVISIKKYKEANDGYLSLGNALKTGIGVALLSGLIFIIYFYVFAKFIEPEFINNSVALNIQKALERSPNIPQEALDAQENISKKYFFGFAFGFILIFNLFIGFVVSLITGLIMKKTDEEITTI